MSAKRFTGKTESDAVMNAAMELGIPSTDLKYTVIDSGSNGFLGLFKKPVIIEIKEEEKETEVMKSQTIEKEQPKKKAEKKPSKKVDEKSNRQPKKSPKVKDEVPVKEPRKNKTPENIDQIVKDTEKYLDEVLRAMGLDPKLNLYYNRRDNVLNINVSGEKMGALIGKHGQTLDALQYLISLYVNKERRQQTLEKLAGSIAYKVKKNKKPIYLEPMNPNERRIIHSALQRDPEVITKSEGKDPYRKVVVMLKK